MCSSISNRIDSGIKWASDGFVNVGSSIKGSNVAGNIAGSVLVGIGNFIDNASNFVGDAVDVTSSAIGVFVDGAKTVAATVTNAIADGAQAVWDWISFWD